MEEMHTVNLDGLLSVYHVSIIPKTNIHDTCVTFPCIVFGHTYYSERHAVNYDGNSKCLSYQNRIIMTPLNIPNIRET